jgi:hypothetical protein
MPGVVYKPTPLSGPFFGNVVCELPSHSALFSGFEYFFCLGPFISFFLDFFERAQGI